MTKEVLLKKFDELTTEYTDKEAKLEAYVQRWLDGDSALSNATKRRIG